MQQIPCFASSRGAVIKLRAHDGRNAPIFFTQPPAPGVWRPTTPGTTMAHPWMGFVTPLLVRRASQFAPPDPPALTSARYTRDFNGVKAVGSATSTVRTQAQTDTARFYSGNPATIPDPGWVSLFPAPAYPEYPSGYVSLVAVASHGLAEVLGTRHLHGRQ